MAINGFTGKILRINLTNSTVSTVETSDYIPQYIGGRGIATRIYWEEIGPEVEALSPENKLIFMTGPLQGTVCPASGRLVLVSKAPQTYPIQSIADSNCGGFVGNELKFAGWDGLIVEGKAPKPTYIYIKDDQVLFLDARTSRLWGLNTYATQEKIWKKHGSKTKMLVIGQAGEHLSPISTISTESGSTFGQGGFGAVMGSKNLKAIAVRGTGFVQVAEPKELLTLKEHFRKLKALRFGETVKGFQGKEISYVFQRASIGDGLALGELVEEGKVEMGYAACDQCPMMRRRTVKFLDNSMPPGSLQCLEALVYRASEQEYYGNEKQTGKVQELCAVLFQQYGLNAWELGDESFYIYPGFSGFLATFKRLYKEGVLTPENTGWPVDKIGSQEFIEVFTHDIAYGKGFGAICAQGGPRVLEYIASHEEFGPKRGIALTHKRRLYPKAGNFSGYGTHHNLGHLFNMTQYSSALYWGIANRDPMTKHTDLCVYKERFDGLGVELESDLWYEMMRKMMQKWIGTTKPIEPPGYEDAEIVARWLWQMNFEEDCLMMCDGTARQRFWCPYTEDGIGDPEEGAKLYKAVTGHNVTQQELWKKCEVPWTLERAIACREGRRASDDIYNDEFYPDTRDNKGRQIEKEMMKSGMQKFYALIGWNSDGVPTRARLEELGMKDVADDLENRGVL